LKTHLISDKVSLVMAFVDAICVKIINQSLVLYGRGNQLVLVNGTEELINETRPYDKIHKISIVEIGESVFSVVCAAGRQVFFTEIAAGQFRNNLILRFNDWIDSIKIFNNLEVAFITSHNFATCLRKDQNTVTIRETLRCKDNSTLYCSHIHGTSWDEALFFAGKMIHHNQNNNNQKHALIMF